jgi:hypothetical protein
LSQGLGCQPEKFLLAYKSLGKGCFAYFFAFFFLEARIGSPKPKKALKKSKKAGAKNSKFLPS